MIQFLDGPAAGTILDLRRVPVFLRVATIDGEAVDALDQLDDTPKPEETIHVYKRQGKAGAYHLLVRGPKARERGGWWATAEYALFETQPDEATLRDTALWRAWCAEQMKAE